MNKGILSKSLSVLLVMFIVFTAVSISPSSALLMSLTELQEDTFEPPIEVNVKHVTAGADHSLAVCSYGVLWAWGVNYSGELGNGTQVSSAIPLSVMYNVAFSSAYYSSMSITSDGVLYTWGANWGGQLGDGSLIARYTPQRVLDNVRYVSVGATHTMAIRADESLWAWGNNDFGQLGNNSYDAALIPIQIMENIAHVSAGATHTLAITSAGVLYAWGHNNSGQLGDGTFTNRNSAVRVKDNVTQISAGFMYSLAVCANNGLWAWGDNGFGQLGDGTLENRSTPVNIMDNVDHISTGTWIIASAVSTTGNLYIWGGYEPAALVTDIEPVFSGSLTPQRLMGGVSTVSMGAEHALIICINGNLWAWGNNWFGQLGDGTAVNTTTPILIMQSTGGSIAVNDPVDEIVIPDASQVSLPHYTLSDYEYSQTEAQSASLSPMTIALIIFAAVMLLLMILLLRLYFRIKT